MTITTKRSLIALLMSLVLVVSLFTIGISADNDTADTAETTVEATSDNGTDADESGAKAETGTKAESKTEAKTEAATEDPDVVKQREEAAALKASTKKTLIINGIIIGAIILVLVLFAVKFRKKLGDFLRSVKSELKKIVWTSKENTRKSFLVVAVVAVLIALLLFIVDYAFKSGLGMLSNLVK